jgi:8-hydroxy-5-deazaflavin:NADPH oxidoreductase
MRIGIIGAGQVGSKLEALFSAAEHDVVAASRAAAHKAAAHGEIVVLALPFAAAGDALPPLADALAGKVVVDATNPVAADWSPLLLGQENSAGEEIARMLPRSQVVKAFNSVFADVMTPERLAGRGQRATCFIAGDDPEACKIVADLAGTVGFSPVKAGPLKLARYLEAMAHLNIAIALAGGGTGAAFVYDQDRV